MKKNKITIYLFKDIQNFEDIILDKYKTSLNKNKLEIDDNKIFYYNNSFDKQPSWKTDFFDNTLDDIKIFSKIASGLLLVKLDNNIFAVPFGYGHNFLDKSLAEENFGLKLVLNIIDHNSIRKISKRTLSSEPKNILEQLSKVSSISDFIIDIEQDLVEEITGKPKKDLFEKFGENQVQGKTSFNISYNIDISNINDFLKLCFEYFNKNDYKENFGFIDFIKEVKNTEELDNKIISAINSKKVEEKEISLWLAVPEIIKWEDIKGFQYEIGRKRDLFDDIYIKDFLSVLDKNKIKNIDLKFLKNKKVVAIKTSNDQVYERWSIYKTIYAELKYKNDVYILTNNKWYKIDNNFSQKINNFYKDILSESKTFSLPESKFKNEEDYNQFLAKEKKAILLDQKNVTYGGGHSSIEVCDVYDKKSKSFIHIKKYSGSSTLSHLFAQGEVSAQLILQDADFRKKAIKKEPKLKAILSSKPNPNDYNIVFGVISKSKKDFNLPFFSKIKLKNTKNLLDTFGYKNVYLVKIINNT